MPDNNLTGVAAVTFYYRTAAAMRRMYPRNCTIAPLAAIYLLVLSADLMGQIFGSPLDDRFVPYFPLDSPLLRRCARSLGLVIVYSPVTRSPLLYLGD